VTKCNVIRPATGALFGLSQLTVVVTFRIQKLHKSGQLAERGRQPAYDPKRLSYGGDLADMVDLVL
jgi:hypothetical protein